MNEPRAGAAAGVGILILAGGQATRLPGKLALPVGGEPLVVRVYRNFALPGRETYLACNGAFARELRALLPIPAIVVDRWPLRGPLGGMLTTMAHMRSPYVFAIAGDAPFVTADVLDRLLAERRPGDEAIVPERSEAGRRFLEPLAALYDREAFLREGLPVLNAGRGSLRLVIDRLRVRLVPVEGGRTFANVNTPDDYAALIEALAANER